MAQINISPDNLPELVRRCDNQSSKIEMMWRETKELMSSLSAAWSSPEMKRLLEEVENADPAIIRVTESFRTLSHQLRNIEEAYRETEMTASSYSDHLEDNLEKWINDTVI